MPPSNQSCVTPEELTQNREVQKRNTASQLDDIERRVNELANQLRQGRQASNASSRFQNTARFSFSQKMKSAMRLVSSMTLRPDTKPHWFSKMMAKQFAVWKKYAGLSDEASIPGQIRQQFVEAKRKFTNDLPHNIGRWAIEERVASAWEGMKGIKKKYKINDKDWNDLAVQAVELSYSRWAKHYYNTGTKGLEFIKHRFDRFKKFMDDLGLEEKDQEFVLRMGRQTADSYHQALKIAQEMGVNVAQLENMEFFPRQMSEDLKQRFAWAKMDDGTIQDNEGNTIDLGNSFMKSRNTHKYVIEDEIVLDAFMTKQGVWDDPIIKEQGITTVSELLDPDNGLAMNHVLFNALSDNDLEALVESGIVSKIPMTSTEWRTWLSKKFPLPSDNLNTLFQTDWHKAFQGYQQQLKKATGESGMVWSLIANAVGWDGNKQPWGITEFDKRKDEALDPEKQEFGDWVKVFPDSPGDQNALLNESLMQQFVRSKADKSGEIPQAYVHPVVSEMFKSMMDMTQDPFKLGWLAEAVREFNNNFKRVAVTSPTFMTQQFVNAMIQMWSAGGNFMQYLGDVWKTTNFLFDTRMREQLGFGRNLTFEESMDRLLDNTKRVYRGIGGELVTEKELYRQGRRLGFLNDFIPGLGEEVDNKHFAVGRGNVKGLAKVFTANWQQLGAMNGTRGRAKALGIAGRDALGLMRRTLLDPFSSTFMLATNEFENAGRFGTLKSLTFDADHAGGNLSRKMKQARQFVTTQEVLEYSDLESAVQHAQNYFFMFDDQGRLDTTIRDYVIPFWSFVSRNPPAQLRNAIRHPVKYGNWLRMYGAVNGREDVEEEIGTPTENIVPKWVEWQRPLYWTASIDETPDEAEREMPFYFPTRPYDPVGDAFTTIGNFGDRVLQHYGIFPTDAERQPGAPRKGENIDYTKSNTWSFLDFMLQNSYGQYKGLAGAILKREIGQDQEKLVADPTKRQKSTLLGLEMNPRVKYLLGESFPMVQRLNSMNPFGLLGTKGGYVISDDGESVEVVEPERSIFGGERTDFDKDQYYEQASKTFAGAIGKVFLGTNFIDPMYNGARRISDVRNTIRELGDQVKRQRSAIEQAQDPQRVKELQTELEAMLTTYLAMRKEHRRLLEWADEQGLRPLEAYRRMKQEEVSPPPLDKAKRQEEYQKGLKEVFENTPEDVKEELRNGGQ